MASEPTDEPKPRMSRAERLDEVHKRAMERFDYIWGVVKEERAQALRDRRFATIRGAQWEGQFAVGAEPDGEEPANASGLPRMEVNKTHKSLIRLYSEYRSDRVTVDFKAKDDDSDSASADNLDGLYRADENDTLGGGQAAYDNAYDEATAGGIGAWRYRTRYEDESDEENDYQRCSIEAIYDADQCVFFDLDDKSQQKAEAQFAFLLNPMSRDAFERAYPNATPATFADKLSWDYEWVSADTITVAEYYEVEDSSVLRRTFRNIATGDERTEDDATLIDGEEGMRLEDELNATGWEEVRSRKIKRQKVRKYLLSGAETLRDEGRIAGKYIPITMVYGKRWFVSGVERSMGHTRLAIDPQRIYNTVVSSLVEGASGPTEDTPIVFAESVRGYEDVWARRKVDRLPYLPLNPILGENGEIVQSGLVGTVAVAQVAPNIAAILQVAASDIADLTGESEQAETVPSNTSADAIQQVHDRADMRSFIYKDNFRKAMEWGGNIWLEIGKDIYVEKGRKMTAIAVDGTKSKIELAEEAIAPNGGKYIKNDLTSGNYDVIVDVGPSSRTRKDQTAKTMTSVAQVYAEIGNVEDANAALGVAVINTEGEGLEAYRQYIRRKGLAAGWVEPTEQEAKEIEAAKANQPAQEDPNVTIANAQKAIAEAEVMKAQIAAQDSNTKVIVAQANSEKARADAAATLAGIDRADRDQVLKAVETSTKVDAHEHDAGRKAIDATMAVEKHKRDMSQGNDDAG